ncbi:rCG49147 [Rattus norvegicus]|uniref:RCG49147 n=1 Tax=Rattus norvegicus TaxID=10116 RepID=A6IGV3_RAT|nr:rCG49147 [Rattus norvegicus]
MMPVEFRASTSLAPLFDTKSLKTTMHIHWSLLQDSSLFRRPPETPSFLRLNNY